MGASFTLLKMKCCLFLLLSFFLCYILYKCMLVSFVFVFFLNNEFSATAVGHHKMVQTFSFTPHLTCFYTTD